MENKFSEAFAKYACAGDTISAEIEEFTIVARIVYDDDAGTPWEREDGHGPVSDWTRRDKRPGERLLNEDRGSKRYYDFAQAVQLAKRDGWEAPPYGQGTKGERAARAAEHDFKVLRAWCNDEWKYCGIVLSVVKDDVTLTEHAASLWGIELNYPDSDNAYLTEVANELLDEALSVGKQILAKLRA